MSTWRRWAAGAGFALGVSTLLAATVPANAGGDPPAVDPAALRILKQMTDHLDGLQQFSVTTQNTIEDLLVGAPGRPRHVGEHHRQAAEQAARRAYRRIMNQTFYYDGKTLTLYNPVENVYASHVAPETIEGMVNLARETVGIVLPAADLVYRRAYPL